MKRVYCCIFPPIVCVPQDDYFTDLDIEDTAGVLFQQDQMLSTREVGNSVHKMSQYLDQSDVILEYISENWP